MLMYVKYSVYNFIYEFTFNILTYNILQNFQQRSQASNFQQVSNNTNLHVNVNISFTTSRNFLEIFIIFIFFCSNKFRS